MSFKNKIRYLLMSRYVICLFITINIVLLLMKYFIVLVNTSLLNHSKTFTNKSSLEKIRF